MTVTVATQNELVDRYLKSLRRAARHLPEAEREELVRSIEGHVEEALAEDPSDADLRSMLDRLGEPERLVEDAYGPAPAPARGWMEWAAIVLLLIGGFVVPFLGWVAGVVLLWASSAWNVREKLIGTLVVPGGLMLPVYGLLVVSIESCSSYQRGSVTVSHCTGGASSGGQVALAAAGIVLLIAPIVTAVFLARRAARPTPD